MGESPNIYASLVFIALMGLFILPMLPVGYNFIAEITYPCSEVMSVGIMMVFGQFLVIVLTQIASRLGSTDNSINT